MSCRSGRRDPLGDAAGARSTDGGAGDADGVGEVAAFRFGRARGDRVAASGAHGASKPVTAVRLHDAGGGHLGDGGSLRLRLDVDVFRSDGVRQFGLRAQDAR